MTTTTRARTVANPASPDRPVAGAAPATTRRVWLARAASTAIAQTDDLRATAGPQGRWRTLDGARSLDGVVAIEGGDDRVELALHVDAVWPPRPLAELADEVRLRTIGEAENAERDGELGSVRVFFHDVVDPDQRTARR